MANIAFIGLGNMGAPMAANLIKAGRELTLYDVVPEAVQKLAGPTARPAASAQQAVKDADFVISMLPAGSHVEDLYLGGGQVLRHAKPSALLIDCSTIAPATAKRVAQAARDQGFAMIDAPVSGGTSGAANATLTFIVGGAGDALERARPLLAQMGKNIFHAGTNGDGQMAKVCNNMLLGVLMIGTSEALSLGVANGLDPKVLSDIIGKSSGRNWSLEVYNPYPGVMADAPAARGYQGGFGVDLMLKDLRLAVESAVQSKTPTPLGALAHNLYDIHSKSGAGPLDFSSIITLLKRPQGGA